MLEVTIKLNGTTLTMSNESSDSIEDCIELVGHNMSLLYGETIDLLLYEEVEDDEVIYCQGIEPIEEREMDGL